MSESVQVLQAEYSQFVTSTRMMTISSFTATLIIIAVSIVCF